MCGQRLDPPCESVQRRDVFIDRHVTPGAKRPPAPSVSREPEQSARKKA
jgi:hypothetical protein